MATGDTYTAEESAYQAEQGRRQNALLTSYAALHESLQQMAKDLQEHQKLAFSQSEAEKNRQERAALEKGKTAQEDIQNKISQGYLDVATAHQKMLEKEPSAEDRANAAAAEKTAALAASQGEDVSAIPGLSPATRQLYGKISQSANEAQSALHGHAKNLADIMNEKAMVDQSIPLLAATAGTGASSFSSDKRKAAYDAAQQLETNKARQVELNKILQSIDPKHLQLITYDPSSGAYVPSVLPPKKSRALNYAAPTTGTGTNDLGAEMNTGRSLNYAPATGTNAPVSQPMMPSPSYLPGRRYGNLRYIGGDPMVEESWQPVTAP